VKAPPLEDGEVEIGYGMAPAYQGRGLATQAARALTDEALAQGASRVSAFTAPDNTASCRLLQRIGYVRDGEMIDPDDGLVWRWVRERAESTQDAHAWTTSTSRRTRAAARADRALHRARGRAARARLGRGRCHAAARCCASSAMPACSA